MSKSAMPVPKLAVSVSRVAEALRRLGVTPDALRAAPQITPLLKKADGGLKAVMMAMRMAPDDTIAMYLQAYDALPVGDRDRVPLEAIAMAAGIEITNLLGSIMVALQKQAQNVVKIIAMTSHHKITEARVKYGLMPYGERDRNALDTAMGFLPSPKGPTFIGKAVFGATQEKDDDDEENGNVDIDKLFPSVSLMQEKLNPIRQKMLPGGSS